MKGITAIVALFALASAMPHHEKYEARVTETYNEQNLGQNTLEPVYLWNVQKELWEIPQCDTDSDCEEKYTVDPYTCVLWCVETNLELMHERSAVPHSEF